MHWCGIHQGTSRRAGTCLSDLACFLPSHEIVTWTIQGGDHGNFVYTLPELAARLGIPAPGGDLPEAVRTLAQPPTYRWGRTRQTKNPGSAPEMVVGPKALNSMRAQDLRTIEAHRGGFLKHGLEYPDGSIAYGRRKVLQMYAEFLHGTREIDQATALDHVRTMAANTQPPWPDAPTDPTPEALVRAVYAKRWTPNWKDILLCELLGITAEVARDIGTLVTIMPKEVKDEIYQARPTKAEEIRRRRAWLKDYLDKNPNPAGGGRWSGRKIRDLLSPLAPSPWWKNHTTANQDLNAIGYKTAGKHARRGK